jgi:hypothetical protein
MITNGWPFCHVLDSFLDLVYLDGFGHMLDAVAAVLQSKRADPVRLIRTGIVVQALCGLHRTLDGKR